MEHRPSAQLGVPFEALQAAAQAPQLCTSPPVNVSQPSPAPTLQLEKPLLHAMLQIPALQLGVPFAVLHAFGQEPQCSKLLPRVTSQPFAALPSQLPKPFAQLIPHTLAVQVAVPFVVLQTLPHAPQLVGLVAVDVSQPSSIAPGSGPSQSLKPALQP